jgi:hypothetical protein
MNRAPKVNSVTQTVIEFAKDFVDRRAKQRQSKASWPDAWAILVPVVSSVTTLLEAWKKIVTELLGVPGTVTLVLLCALGIVWSVHIIRATDWENTEHVYKFVSALRQTAKAAFVLLSILSPAMVATAFTDIWPLPLAFYGELRDLKNNPIPDISVRVLDNGEDVTSSKSFPTDRDGFYIIETTRQVRRSAKLVARCPKGPVELSMMQGNQIEPDRSDLNSSSVVFRHLIECEVQK